MIEDEEMTIWYFLGEKDDEVHCPNCGSQNIRYRDNVDLWICQDCDFEWGKNQ